VSEATVRAKLDGYRFSGLDASQLGAAKSAADYYGIPLSATKLFAYTGLAFASAFDEGFSRPNAGPPEPDVFRLARNLGLGIEGIHRYAEGEAFCRLQAEAWELAQSAIRAGHPVFAKNVAQWNQTSVITAIDEKGYYVDSWHTGFERWDEVIPWDSLGLSRCPCINCVNERGAMEPGDPTSGLISLHWVRPVVPAQDDRSALKEALEFALARASKGTYEEFGERYWTGAEAFAKWGQAVESGRTEKYEFALLIEVVSEARRHALRFLTELRDGGELGLTLGAASEAVRVYDEISGIADALKERYPYEQPRESFDACEGSEVAEALSELARLEKRGLSCLGQIYGELRDLR